jgi:hypothetical protein
VVVGNASLASRDDFIPTMGIFSLALAIVMLHSASVHAVTDQTAMHRRHDYKQSFKRPYYFNGTIPFFDYYQSISFYGD